MDSTTELYPGEGLPFITVATDDSGPINYLDVRADTYCKGLDEGMRAAYRLMCAREKGVLTTHTGEVDDDLDGTLRYAIEFAAKVLGQAGGRADNEVRGAAVGFLSAVTRMLGDLAMSGAWRTTMMKDVADTNNFNRIEFEGHLASNARLVEDVTASANSYSTHNAKRAVQVRKAAIAA
jgi:hypothetical protein